MRLALLISVILAQTAFAASAVDPKNEPVPTPLMRTVEPYTAKVGMVVVVTGDNLQEKIVGDVYLTADGKNFQVEVISQTEKQIKFKVPAVKAGPYRVLVLMKSFEPVFIEEPVKLLVEE